MTRAKEAGERRHGSARRGIAGLFERSWSGAAMSRSWTRLLAPLAFLYGVGAARARARAARRRSRVQGIYVVAVGGLTVGGSGKSSLARWLASQVTRECGKPAILLRGHGASDRVEGTLVLPDYRGYPLERAARRGGDEAAAHRAALGTDVVIGVDPDRRRAAEVVRQGYGVNVVILDDGWEQGTLAWDELWVALDPLQPFGNGLLLPAGPLRRPVGTIAEAQVIAMIHEEAAEVPAPDLLDRLRALAPRAHLLRLARALRAITPLDGENEGAALAPGMEWRPAALISGIGSPERLDRFARAMGLAIVHHAAFPDHARWSGPEVRQACAEALRSGAELVLLTDKDEARWPRGLDLPLPVAVLRTSLRPLVDPGSAIQAIREALAAAAGTASPGVPGVAAGSVMG